MHCTAVRLWTGMEDDDMNEFMEKVENGLKEAGEDIKEGWDSAKESFERLAADENAELAAYHDLFTWANGTLLATPYTDKEISEKDKQMKTLAVMLLKDQTLVSPAAGTIERIEPEQNTILLRTDGGQLFAIKVCLSAVSFLNDADILVDVDQPVTAGQPLVRFHKPIEAKSKLLLLEPQAFELFKGLGYTPAAKPGDVHAQEILITDRKA